MATQTQAAPKSSASQQEPPTTVINESLLAEIPESMVVIAGGPEIVNGTYKQLAELMNGAAAYQKEGLWNGLPAQVKLAKHADGLFHVYLPSKNYRNAEGVLQNGNHFFFKGKQSADADASRPPMSGYEALHDECAGMTLKVGRLVWDEHAGKKFTQQQPKKEIIDEFWAMGWAYIPRLSEEGVEWKAVTDAAGQKMAELLEHSGRPHKRPKKYEDASFEAIKGQGCCTEEGLPLLLIGKQGQQDEGNK